MGKKRIETASSRTAAWTCLCRAVSSGESNSYYRSGDYVARSLLPELLRIPYSGKLLIKLFAAKGLYEYVIARTRYIDSAVKECLSNCFSQVLVFGAGFDTRALRLQDESQKARFFELDAAATQEAKLAQYNKRHLDIPLNVVFVPIDFDRESPGEKLHQAGFKSHEKSLFILEGVLMYLQPQSADRTLRIIRDLSSARSEIVFDYILASVLRQEGTSYGEKGAANMVAKQGEQWNFGIEKGEVGQLLAGYGYKLLDHRDANDLEAMYFTDPSGRKVGKINATHCMARAVRVSNP